MLNGYGFGFIAVYSFIPVNKLNKNICLLLNQRNAERIECVFPHAFIHYENKLRTKQFFELCTNIIPGIDKELTTLAINYNGIISSATEIAAIAYTQGSFPKDSLKEKREHIIELLRRSSEQEELALSYTEKAAANIRK